MAAEASDPDTKRLLLRAAEEWRFLYDQHVADLHQKREREYSRSKVTAPARPRRTGRGRRAVGG
jgi:hypothetical protein